MRLQFMGLSKQVFVPVLASLLCFGAGNSVLAEEFMRTITVTGQGDEAIATSIAEVSLAVQVEGKTAEEAQAAIAKRSNQVMTFLKSKNVEKLTTTGVYLQPQYDYSDGNSRLTGYMATNSVRFEVPNAEAGSIIDNAVKAGATNIDGISFRATDAAIAEAEQVALAEAAQHARTQAQTVLASLGLSPQDIVQIQVNGAMPPMPVYKSLDVRAVAAEAMPSPVEGGEQTVNASVTLTIRY